MSRAATVGVIAGLVGGSSWIAKLVIMAFQGGPDPQSVPESIAFFAGLLGVAVAAAALGVLLTRGRPAVARLAAALGGVVCVALLIGAGQALLTALPGDSWIQEEAVFGVLGLLALITAAVLRQRESRPA
jgi:hypothetical protein